MRQGGYAVIVDPDGGKIEASTFTCAHCNSIVHVWPKMKMDDLGSMCRNCMKMVCAKCSDLGCVPFEKKLERLEARDRALRSYGV